MKVHNLMEDLVKDLIESTLAEIPDACTCDQCKSDIAAIVLNEIKPKYVASVKGTLFSKTDRLSYKLNTEIIMRIVEAQMFVSKSPRHEVKV